MARVPTPTPMPIPAFLPTSSGEELFWLGGNVAVGLDIGADVLGKTEIADEGDVIGKIVDELLAVVAIS